MDIRKLDGNISVSAQIDLEDIAKIKALGFRTLISNRPDSEEAGQPSAKNIADEALLVGIKFFHIPVISGAMSLQDMDAFSEVMARCEKPVLAFCRSGKRSAMLWTAVNPGGLSTHALYKIALSAGYDFKWLTFKR
jgi:sulfide:quinone oxidoreductase